MLGQASAPSRGPDGPARKVSQPSSQFELGVAGTNAFLVFLTWKASSNAASKHFCTSVQKQATHENIQKYSRLGRGSGSCRGSRFVTASVRRCDQTGSCRRPQTDLAAHLKVASQILTPSVAKSATCLHPAHQCGGLSLGMRSRPSMTKQISVADERRCFRFSKKRVGHFAAALRKKKRSCFHLCRYDNRQGQLNMSEVIDPADFMNPFEGSWVAGFETHIDNPSRSDISVCGYPAMSMCLIHFDVGVTV